MHFKKIRTRMLALILPIIIVAFALLMVVSIIECRDLVFEQVNQTMMSEIGAQEGEMGEYLHSVSNMSQNIADMVEASYTTTDMEQYEATLSNLIAGNDMVLGSGLWFEPYVYDPSSEFYGPYVYKDGGSIVTTWDYSNAEYDYFSQEYYLNSKGSDGPVFTDPYYDETSDTIMSSCSCPIIVNGQEQDDMIVTISRWVRPARRSCLPPTAPIWRA